MSYRSFKKVLGETNLERKCRFLFGGCLLLLIFGSFGWYGCQNERLVYKQNPRSCRQLVSSIVIGYHWERLESNTEFKKVYVTPLNEALRNAEEYRYDWNSLQRNGRYMKGGQLADAWELAQLQQFAELMQSQPAAVAVGPDSESRHLYRDRTITGPDGEPLYQYYQPIRAERLCIDCHSQMVAADRGVSGASPMVADAGLNDGDLMRVIRVDIPFKSTQQQLDWNRAILVSTGFITAFLAMVASYIIVRYVIVKPLKHLRDVSDAIGRGEVDMRADIRTGDEFQALGAAFNRMVRSLVEAQEDLRHVNDDLDAKVDELAQANMRLYEVNRLKSDFLATMSHELRTPLNSIIGFSEVLSGIESLDDKQRRYVGNIQKSGRMLLTMINDILDLAKIESGKMEVRLSEFKIDHVVQAQCDLVRPLTEKKNIDLLVNVEPNLSPLRQDQPKVQQVLNNLLSNAVKFTPEGGRITVAARRLAAGDLLLSVEDTGVGISDVDQQHIFEKFRQGEAVLRSGDPLTRDYSGTGLGLSIVKELCKLLGGEITLASELGKGSVFSVQLPWQLMDRPRLDSMVAGAIEDLSRLARPELDRIVAESQAAVEASRSLEG